MQTINVKTIFFLAFVLIMATGIDAIAQRGWGMGRRGGVQQVCPNIPDLSEEQMSQIMQLRTAHLSEMQSYRDQIDANRVKYQSLLRGGMADLSAINVNIDERNSIRSEMDKKLAAHHNALRSLLTEEQRVWFDSARGFGPGIGIQPGMPLGVRGAGMMVAPGRRGMWQSAPYGYGGRGAGMMAAPGRRGMWRSAPYGYGGRGAYCPWF